MMKLLFSCFIFLLFTTIAGKQNSKRRSQASFLSDTTKIFLLKTDTSFDGGGQVHGEIYHFSNVSDSSLMELSYSVGGWDMGQANCTPSYRFKSSAHDGIYLIYMNAYLQTQYKLQNGEKVARWDYFNFGYHGIQYSSYPVDSFFLNTAACDSLKKTDSLLLKNGFTYLRGLHGYWDGCGQETVYNKNYRLKAEGTFSHYKLYDGKFYVYNCTSELTRVMCFKNGKYTGDGSLDSR